MTERIWIPVDSQDALDLQEMLSRERLFVSAHVPEQELYSMATYIGASKNFKQQVFMLLDRNLQTRLADIGRCRDVSEFGSSQSWRTAAATLAFCITSSIQIEPTISLYENAFARGQDAAVSEYYYLRLVDHCHPQVLANIGLGRSDALDSIDFEDSMSRALPISMPDENFEKRLNDLVLFEIFVMQAQLLKGEDAPPWKRLSRYFEWQRDEAIFSSVATNFALILFGNRRSISLIKDQSSGSRQKVLHGLQNAAWDLLHADYFRKKTMLTPKNEVWIFASQDVQLRRIASSWYTGDSPDHDHDNLKAKVDQYYTLDQAQRIYDVLPLIETSSERSGREKHRQEFFSRIHEIHRHLKAQLKVAS